MAHHVVIDKTPVLSKDRMRVLKGKYTYKVRCKRCGTLHAEKITSEGLANLCKANHFVDVHHQHHSKHPDDKAHLRTDRRKQKKMVNPRG